jgi:hypothetical protein
LLNPDAHPMLIRVEKKQLLECGTLLHGQLRRNHDWLAQYPLPHVALPLAK